MSEDKRVVVTGATGMIGRSLCKQLSAKGYQVVAFSRNPQKARTILPGAAEYVEWSPEESGPWASAIDGAHAVIHLAGASLFGQRWTSDYKREILRSREVGTRGLVKAMAAAASKPAVFVSMSAVGYYGPHGPEKIDESAPVGHDFLAHVCDVWEREAKPAAELGVRTVLFRSGVVLDNAGQQGLPIDLSRFSLLRPGFILDTDAGAFPLLAFPFKLFAGGPIMPGTQYLSWIHHADSVSLIVFALEDDRVAGPFNATAPDPEPNKEIARILGRVMGRPSWLPVPGFALHVGLGEMADMITTGQRVLPSKAQELGFQFAFPTAEAAIRDILKS